MAAATQPKKPLVDFTDLEELGTHDLIRIRFKKEEPRDVRYLLNLLRDNVVRLMSTGDQMLVDAIMMSNNWDGGENRNIMLLPGPAFSTDDFTNVLSGRIDLLEVKRTLPLVDLDSLQQDGVVLRFRFRADSMEGVAEPIELHEMELIELNHPSALEEVFATGDWSTHGRSGRFVCHLAGNNRDYQVHFIKSISPHLELLRS